MHAILFANGISAVPDNKIEFIKQAELIIAADNGAKYCEALNVMPHVLIGDLDSISETILEKYKKHGVKIIKAPPMKDETDLELALSYAQEQGATMVHLFGALGKRADMTFANLLICLHPDFITLDFRFYTETEEIFLIKDKKEFVGKKNSLLSLIPLCGNVTGVTTEGVAYPLVDEELIYGVPRGVSNSIVSERAWVSVETGSLLCVISSE